MLPVPLEITYRDRQKGRISNIHARLISCGMEERKIYTRKGDLGTTSLFTGGRVSKTNIRIQSYGAVDELNSFLGVARTFATHPDIPKLLFKVQNKVMNIISILAAKDELSSERPLPTISEADVTGLEHCIDYFNQKLSPISNFIVPGGNKSGAFFDVARTVCRRAEREVIKLSESEIVDPILRKFLNRLSDLLFVLERVEYQHQNTPEKFWDK